MQPESARFLYDMRQAIDFILEFVEGRTIEEYFANRMLRAAVERELEILGEAMSWIARVDPATADRISESREIIGLRNILIHRYFRIDSNIVWDIIHSSVAALRDEIDSLLRDEPG